MSEAFSAGAYVIRNKGKSTVLQIENPDVRTGSSSVLLSTQDENLYHDQQIWWIEPLPNCEDSDGKTGLMYSITNPPSKKHFGSTWDEKLSACQEDGSPWQWWKFQRVHQCKEGVYYHIITARNRVLNISSKDSKLNVGGFDFPSGSDEHCWELVTPAVCYPPGWIQIQSAGTGDILSHIYLHDPPVLLPRPESPRPSQYREGWQSQWTIIHSRSLEPASKAGGNSWSIQNRLTGANLVNITWDVNGARLDRVNAFRSSGGATWKLELDRSHNWKIVNIMTGFLLEQTIVPRSGGMQVNCIDKIFPSKEGTKSWVLRPPLLETNDESPPDYKA